MVHKYLLIIGKNIKQIRNSKHLSQEKLGELVNKSRNYIGMIERAEVNTPLSTISEIAIALNVEPKDFFNFNL